MFYFLFYSNIILFRFHLWNCIDVWRQSISFICKQFVIYFAKIKINKYSIYVRMLRQFETMINENVIIYSFVTMCTIRMLSQLKWKPFLDYAISESKYKLHFIRQMWRQTDETEFFFQQTFYENVAQLHMLYTNTHINKREKRKKKINFWKTIQCVTLQLLRVQKIKRKHTNKQKITCERNM